jgi:hypothetical protein
MGEGRIRREPQRGGREDVSTIMPVKDSHTRTRIKPLALASGHGRYITATPEPTILSVGGMTVTYGRYKFVTVTLPNLLRNGRFTSETATWNQKRFKIPAGAPRKLYI